MDSLAKRFRFSDASFSGVGFTDLQTQITDLSMLISTGWRPQLPS